MKKIYLLYSCNIWAEKSSMRLMVATTNINDVLKILRKNIKNNKIIYQTHELSPKEQLQKFDEDFKTLGYDVIDNCDYCFMQTVNDGEEQ